MDVSPLLAELGSSTSFRAQGNRTGVSRSSLVYYKLLQMLLQDLLEFSIDERNDSFILNIVDL